MNAPPVSQRDIARHFGVSHVTVSLALRHSNRVSKSLGDRIRDHAEAVGYQRDPLLAALAAYRQRKSKPVIRGVIAWINAWEDPQQMHQDPCMARYWSGASEAAAECGYRLEEFRLGTDLSPERLHQILRTRSIEGILLPPHALATDWGGLPWEKYDIVSLGSWVHGPRGHRVMPGMHANLCKALEEISDRGYRRIACVSARSVLRESGYCMEESFPAVMRLPACGRELHFFDLAEVSGVEAVRRAGSWIRANGIEAVLTDHAPLARSLAASRFPVATMMADDASMPMLAGMDPEFEEIGRSAMRMLDSLTSEGNTGSTRLFRQISIEGTWREGSSLPSMVKPLLV